MTKAPDSAEEARRAYNRFVREAEGDRRYLLGLIIFSWLALLLLFFFMIDLGAPTWATVTVALVSCVLGTGSIAHWSKELPSWSEVLAEHASQERQRAEREAGGE